MSAKFSSGMKTPKQIVRSESYLYHVRDFTMAKQFQSLLIGWTKLIGSNGLIASASAQDEKSRASLSSVAWSEVLD